MIFTFNVAQMFNRAKRGLQIIIAKSKNVSDQEKRLAKNVTASLASSLQDLSANFRKSQSSYLKSKSAIQPYGVWLRWHLLKE